MRAFWLILLAACEPVANAAEFTVEVRGRDAFAQPAPGLRDSERTQFFVGNSYFNQNWVAAGGQPPSRAGLGPRFNARSCSGCHFKDGRGQPPGEGELARSLLMRASMPGVGPHGAPIPEPHVGLQIQTEAVPGEAAEANVRVHTALEHGAFADGTPYVLHVPRYEIDTELSPGALLSPRVAPALIGLGLLEAVPEATLAALEDPNDRDGDGISGRANRVWSEGRMLRGRFGWKAEQPSVAAQSRAAFAGDMGIEADELDDEVAAAVVFYARTLAVPAPGLSDERGRALFETARCASCHVPTLETGDSDVAALRRRTIHAYTDLLLHDMGPWLSDARPSFEAAGAEWRTPPLWGVGRIPEVNGHSRYLHDGRAHDLTEAVLWHDGEGRASRDAFVRMTAAERAALIAFLESL